MALVQGRVCQLPQYKPTQVEILLLHRDHRVYPLRVVLEVLVLGGQLNRAHGLVQLVMAMEMAAEAVVHFKPHLIAPDLMVQLVMLQALQAHLLFMAAVVVEALIQMEQLQAQARVVLVAAVPEVAVVAMVPRVQVG